MRTLWIPAVLVMLAAFPATADFREVIKTTAAGRETWSVSYQQGRNLRSETLDKDGTIRTVSITNAAQDKTYRLNLQAQQYVEWGVYRPDWIVLLANWIARPPRQSGKEVNVYYDVTDTGEKKRIFGHIARHLILRERDVAQPGACGSSYEYKREGWYIPRPELGLSDRYVHFLSFSNGLCDDTIVRHGLSSLASAGFAVREKSDYLTREVVELSTIPLDAGLFGPPAGFKKVDALPGEKATSWLQQLETEWGQLERAFESRFDW